MHEKARRNAVAFGDAFDLQELGFLVIAGQFQHGDAGVVAFIVKADDMGVALANNDGSSIAGLLHREFDILRVQIAPALDLVQSHRKA